MFKHPLSGAIAVIVLVFSISPGVMAQYHRTGSPGFSRSIYIPSARNRSTRYGDGSDYRNPGYSRHQPYRGDRGVTIINGGNNCLNCRVNDSNYRRGDHHRNDPYDPRTRSRRSVTIIDGYYD
ncbi:MAG: hypothetical protein VKL20_01595 [Synechocystis sp.]|nr:hypothetical protein [Synechocystis sp.]